MLPIMAVAAILLLSGCPSHHPPDVADIPAPTMGGAAPPALSRIHISSIRNVDGPRQKEASLEAREGSLEDILIAESPLLWSPTAKFMALSHPPIPKSPVADKTILDGGGENPPGAGNSEAAAGYGLASASAKAAASGESPSPFGGLFGGHASDNSPQQMNVAGNLPADAQRVSLVGLTLRDAVGLAIAHHPDVSRGVAVVSQSTAEVLVAKGAWFPVFNYSIAPGYGTAYSRDTAAGAQSSGGISQLVYDFGKTPGRIEQADAALGRQRHALNSTIEGVAYTAASQYVEFAAAQATLDAAGDAIVNLSKLRGMIAERVRASLSSASDLTQADVAMQRANIDQAQARTRLDVAAANLAEIIGARPQTVAELADVSETITALGNGGGDIENAPVVLAAKAAVKEADAQVKVVKSDYYPAVSLVANKNVMSGGGSNAYDSEWAGVALSGSISAVGQNSHRVESAQANKNAVERQLESQRLSLRTSLVSAETEMAGANTRRQAFDAMKGLSRTSRDLYWQEYTLGKRPLTQVLDAEHDIFSAEAGRIAAVADGLAARLKARATVGLLVSGLRDR